MHTNDHLAEVGGKSSSLREKSIIKIMPNHNMPAFSSFLNDDDIWAALTFTKSTWPPDIQVKQARQSPNNLSLNPTQLI